jgi:hypothetical protein
MGVLLATGFRLLNSIMKRMFLNALLDKLKHAIVECRAEYGHDCSWFAPQAGTSRVRQLLQCWSESVQSFGALRTKTYRSVGRLLAQMGT